MHVDDAMTWSCPACRLPIEHSALESRPRSGVVYRCHICRLELIADPETERLTVTPFIDQGIDERVRRTT